MKTTFRAILLAFMLACVACPLAGCADAQAATNPTAKTTMAETQNPFADIAPWHMWGSSQTLAITNAGGTRLQSTEVQLVKINYTRPETWRFFFGARIVSADAPVPGPTGLDVAVLYSVTTGVGRDVFRTPYMTDFINLQRFFVEFRYVVPAGVVPGFQPYNIKYTSKGTTPQLDDGNPLTSVQEIETVVSEDVQVSATIVLFNPSQMALGSVMQVEVAAFFAPNVHVRPDWLSDDIERAFLGNETGGS